jgi:hypothetical protein
VALDSQQRSCLTKLLPHVDCHEVALTGSIAIELHLVAAGLPTLGRAAGDVDFVATRLTAVAPTIGRDFLISHFHVPRSGYPKFIVQLVDPVSRLRIDVFADLMGAVPNAKRIAVAGHHLLVLDARSILGHKLKILQSASAAQPVDDKHMRDACLLGAMLGEDIEAIPTAHFTTEVHGRDLSACPRCEASLNANFPIASKQQVLDILGYT